MMSINAEFPRLQPTVNRLQLIDACKIDDLRLLEAPLFSVSDMLSGVALKAELTRATGLTFFLNGQLQRAETSIGIQSRRKVANG